MATFLSFIFATPLNAIRVPFKSLAQRYNGREASNLFHDKLDLDTTVVAQADTPPPGCCSNAILNENVGLGVLRKQFPAIYLNRCTGCFGYIPRHDHSPGGEIAVPFGQVIKGFPKSGLHGNVCGCVDVDFQKRRWPIMTDLSECVCHRLNAV